MRNQTEDVAYWQWLSLGFAILLTVVGSAVPIAQPLLLLGLMAMVLGAKGHARPIARLCLALVLVGASMVATARRVDAPAQQRATVVPALITIPPAPLPGPAAFDESPALRTAIVAVDAANVRSSPSVAASVVEQVKYGTELLILGQSADWFKVTLPDQSEGWVAAGWIVTRPLKASNAAAP